METNSLWHAPRVATLVLVVHLFCGLMPGLKAQNFQPTKRFVPSFFLANDQTLILHQDLHLFSDGDVQIDGNVLGQAITQSNAPGQNLFIYAKGDIIINGEIRLGKGGDGQIPELAGLKKNQPYSSSFFAIGTTSSSFYQLAFSAQPFFDVRNGGKGGSLFLEARRIVINGVIQPGDGGDGIAGGAGGSGGTLILLSSIVKHPGMYTLKAGNGGNGGDASQGLTQAGAGGNGGMAVIFACTDGTPGTNGVVSGVAGTGGGNGGTDNDGIACQGGKGGNGGARAAGGAGGNGGSATNTLAGGSALGGAGGDGGNGGDADVSIPGGAGGKGGNGGNGTGSNGSSGSCMAANGGAGFGGAGGKGGNGGDGFLDLISAGSGGNGGAGGNGTGGNAGTCVAVSCSTPTGGAGTGGTGGAGGSRGTGNIVLGGVNGTAGSQGSSTNGLNGSCTLPVELSQFSAASTSTKVQLNWSTSSEINNDYMAIERSSNGQNFLEIGRILGKGTSTETQFYSFTDEQPLQGNNYYRLRQVDFDQSVEYSKVIVQDFKHGQLLSIFPNPARDKVYLQTPLNLEQAKVQLIDAIGRKISINLLGATGWYELALPTDLPRGHYWVVIQNESTQLQTLLIKE